MCQTQMGQRRNVIGAAIGAFPYIIHHSIGDANINYSYRFYGN
jgi:hypothetical protein